MYNKTNNLSVNIMIGLTIRINFMYTHNVTDLVCINFFLRMGKKKRKMKIEKTEYRIPPLQE